MDLLLNRWLLYQTLACRLWARTAFYQSAARTASATSCRSMALADARPELAREHLLRAAAANSSRATCSTGGIRRAAAACARASPTTSSGCRSSVAATSW